MKPPFRDGALPSPHGSAPPPMPRDRLSVSPADLAREADRFAHALDTPEGRAASGLDAAAFAGLAALVADLRAATRARLDAEAARRAAVVVQRAAHRAATARLRALRRQADGHAAMTEALREAAGLPLRRRRRTAPLPVVDGLTALRRPSGAVFLDWTGPTGGALRYEVFGRDPDGADPEAWRLLGAATGTDFVDRSAPPGHPRVYRVEPCRGARRGEPSGQAVVTF